jgi:hypothetical protein
MPTRHRGACVRLSAFACPEHPSAEDNDHLPRSGRLAFSFARLCASLGLAANPRSQRQDASIPLLQPTFHVTSTHVETSLLETLRRAPWETRRRSTSRPPVGARALMGACSSSGDAGPPCGHPASSSFALDGATPASGRSAATFLVALARGGFEAPPLCRLAGAPPNRTL